MYGLEAYRQAIEVAASLAIQTAELIKAAPQLIGRSGGAGLDTVTVVGRH